jgi:hypothetical protein
VFSYNNLASRLIQRYKVFPVFGFAYNRYKNGWWAFVRKRVGKKSGCYLLCQLSLLVLMGSLVVLLGRMRLHRMLSGKVTKSYICLSHTV